MAPFRISAHGRLHEWVAVESAYREAKGLDHRLDVRSFEPGEILAHADVVPG